jgi:membrane protease YdiL (CAAX protease family)
MAAKSEAPLFKRYPLLSFYTLAFLISWIGWVPQALYSRGIFPFDHPLFSFLGGAGPTLAAVLVSRRAWGKQGPEKLFNTLFRWRVSWLWYVFPLLYWGLITVGVLMVSRGGQLAILPISSFSWNLLPAVFATMLLSNVWEEIGWRGFALPEFQKRFSDRVTALIMGLAWFLWHLPLMLDPSSPLGDLPWGGEALFSLGLTVIYIWLFNQSAGSLLPVTLFHAISNTAAFILLELGAFESSYLWVVGITCLTALLIVAAYRKEEHFGSPRASGESG